MKHKNWSVLLGLLVILSMVLTACGGEKTRRRRRLQSPPSLAAVATEAPAADRSPTHAGRGQAGRHAGDGLLPGAGAAEPAHPHPDGGWDRWRSFLSAG